MKILLTTTGDYPSAGAGLDVPIPDIGFDGPGKIPHPTVDKDLLLELDLEDITSSLDLQNAIDSGYITIKDEFGNYITNIENLQSDITPIEVSVPNGTSTVATVDKSLARIAIWNLEISDETSGKYTFQVVKTIHDDTSPKTTIDSVIQTTSLDYDINVVIDGQDLKLNITNNETNNLSIKYEQNLI